MNVRIQSQEEATRRPKRWSAVPRRCPTSLTSTPNEDGDGLAGNRSQHLAQRFPGVGRNDPATCGSGKKFKACHGKLS